MSYFAKKAAALQELLEDASALSKAASQKIKHVDLVSGPNGLGKEMLEEQHAAVQGINADNPAEVPAPATEPRDLQGGVQESINKDPNAAIGEVNTMKEDETPTTKSAALHARLNAIMLRNTEDAARVLSETMQRKTASAQDNRLADKVSATLNKIAAAKAQKAQEQEQEVPTGMGVMRKFASYMQTADLRIMDSIHRDISEMARTNPLFLQAREAVAMRKFAAEVEALADAQNIAPEEAAALLQQSIASDPEAAQEMQGEIDALAAGELAAALELALADEEARQGVAAEVSNMLGEEITPEDIDAAIEDVKMQAAQLGVDPMELIAAAAELMQMASLVTPELEAMAEELVAAAAEQGISPDELIQGLAADVQAEEAAMAGAPLEPMLPKTACLHKLASTKRGANIARMLQNR